MVMPQAAKIGTTYRWSQFLTDNEARRVHLSAFRAIAKLLHSTQLAICASTHNDITTSLMQGQFTQGDCIALLVRELGPPQPTVDEVPSIIAALGPRESQQVWFLDGPAATQ